MKVNWINRKLTLFHGSGQVVEYPDLNHSRDDIDFGAGFYLTENIDMAKKWSCTKRNSYVSEYELDLTDLKIYKFQLDEDWLKFITDNRLMNDNNNFDGYDVLIGPTADDKLYDTLQDYLDGYIPSSIAIKYLNIAGFSNQVVLKTNKACQCLEFKKAIKILGKEKEEIRIKAKEERKETIKKLNIERQKYNLSVGKSSRSHSHEK